MAACLLLTPRASAAQEVRLTLAHGASEHALQHSLFLKPWAQRLPIATAGRLAVAIEATVGTSGSRLLERLKAGDIDLLWAPVAELPGAFADIEVFELPFMAWPAEATSQAAWAFHRTFAPEGPGDIVALLFHADAPAWLHTTGQPVRRLEDLNGKRLYAPTGALGAFLRDAGAEIVTAESAEAAARLLDRGDIDGAVMSFVTGAPAGIVRATKYHLRIDRPPKAGLSRHPGLATRLFVLAIAGKRFRLLPDDLRRALIDSAQRSLAESAGRTWDSVDRLERRNARSEGHVFLHLNDAERQDWRGAAGPVIESWIVRADARGRMGAAMLREARTLTARYHVLMTDDSEPRTRPTRQKGG